MEKNDIRSACNDHDCSTCRFRREPTCYNTEKREKFLPIYFSHI